MLNEAHIFYNEINLRFRNPLRLAPPPRAHGELYHASTSTPLKRAETLLAVQTTNVGILEGKLPTRTHILFVFTIFIKTCIFLPSMFHKQFEISPETIDQDLQFANNDIDTDLRRIIV